MKQGLWGNRVIGRDLAGVQDESPGDDKETSHEVMLYPKGTLCLSLLMFVQKPWIIVGIL